MKKEIKIVLQAGVDYTQIILTELRSKCVHQARIADLYACVIVSDGCADVKEVNSAIIERWSISGLTRVKAMAWKLARNPDVLFYLSGDQEG